LDVVPSKPFEMKFLHTNGAMKKIPTIKKINETKECPVIRQIMIQRPNIIPIPLSLF
jgi:hypothetical protein